MITEQTRPRCKKCEKPALTKIGQSWFCGNCVAEYIKKIDARREKAILEE